MRGMVSIGSAIVLSLQIGASDALHAEERKLSGAEILAVFADRTAMGTDRGKAALQVFIGSGVTYYAVDGAQSQGNWVVWADQYCSRWPPSDSWACYDVMIERDTYTFVSAYGTRYPVTIVD